jgi:5-methylcytosine-specific restriction enzyme subunit McrC
MRAPKINAELKERLRAAYSKLSGIGSVHVTNATFRRVQLNRNSRYYAFLLFICRLVHSLQLPDPTDDGRNRFSDLVSDEKTMEKVFEEFLRNFYRLKQNEFEEVGSVHLKWNAESANANSLRLLPDMRTDITLRSNARTIIMDAKYYKDALQEHYGSRRAHSENLYQLLAYLSAEKAVRRSIRPEGILVYPVGDSTVDARFTIDTYPIRIYTLNLAQDWQHIEKDLAGLLEARPMQGIGTAENHN